MEVRKEVSPLLCSLVSKMIKIGSSKMSLSDRNAQLSSKRMSARVGQGGDARCLRKESTEIGRFPRRARMFLYFFFFETMRSDVLWSHCNNFGLQ